MTTFFKPWLIKSFEIATPAAPEPLKTTLQSSSFLPTIFSALMIAAEQMTGQQVTIIEQPGNYAFILRIHLNDIYSLDLAALRARIDELKPAHLTYTVEQYDPSGIDVRQRYAVMVGEAKHYTLYPHQGGDGNGDMG